MVQATTPVGQGWTLELQHGELSLFRRIEATTDDRIENIEPGMEISMLYVALVGSQNGIMI
jgi:hypothetical protein